MAQGPKHEPIKLQGHEQKMMKLRDKELYLNRGEDDVKGSHGEGSKTTIDREASGSEPGPNQAETVPGRSAQPLFVAVCDAL
jgi:hypothetical protein